jgi:hypothetical protein
MAAESELLSHEMILEEVRPEWYCQWYVVRRVRGIGDLQ